MRKLQAAFTAARLLAQATGRSLKATLADLSLNAKATSLAISAAVSALSLKAEITLGFFLRTFFASDQASVSDSQTLDVTKNNTETPLVVDQSVITLLKIAADSGALTDDEVLTIIKSLSETPAVVEAHLIVLTKPISDTGAITDLPSLNSTKPITEAPSSTDNNILSFTKVAGDDTAFDYCDSTYFAEDYIEGARTDRSFITDSNVIDFTKFINEQTFATDDLDGEASAEDDQEIDFIKTRSEIASVTDLFTREVTYSREFTENGTADESAVKLTTKVHADSGVTSDSGSLRSQGYCDFTYFAEDYVGASRTFT